MIGGFSEVASLGFGDAYRGIDIFRPFVSLARVLLIALVF